MPLRQRLRKLLTKVRHKGSKDKQKSPEIFTASRQDTGDDAAPPAIARERPSFQKHEQRRQQGGNEAKKSQLPVRKRPSSAQYNSGEDPKRESVDNNRCLSMDNRPLRELDEDAAGEVKHFSAIGPASQLEKEIEDDDNAFEESPMKGPEESQANRNALLGSGKDAQRLSKRYSGRSDLMVPSRTMTENTVNTVASSDYENHSTTQSLGPSPVPVAGRELMDNLGDGDGEAGNSSPRAKNQSQPDAVDAFPTSTEGNVEHSNRPETGIEETGNNTRERSRSISKKTASTNLRTHVEPAVVHENIKPVEREIRTEVITREIHYHHIHTTLQPVVERKYLPKKHYLQDEHGRIRPITSKEALKYGEPIWTGEEIIASDPKLETEKMPKALPLSGYKNKGLQADPIGIDRTQSVKLPPKSQGQWDLSTLDRKENDRHRHSMLPVPKTKCTETCFRNPRNRFTTRPHTQPVSTCMDQNPPSRDARQGTSLGDNPKDTVTCT